MTTDAILSAVAHFEFALGMSERIPAFKGFPAYYFAKQDAPTQRLLKRYQKIRSEAAAELEKEYSRPTSDPRPPTSAQ